MLEEAKKSTWQLYREFWRLDLLAAISVSLVALPLALGIAIAAEAPPMSGIIAAVIGGVLTTFIRGSHVAINGPANSLIVLILIGNQMLADGEQSGFPYVLAAVCVAGLFQVALGLLRLGRLGEVVPNSVVQGLLAAIGLIILVKQMHVGLGHHSSAESAMGSIFELPQSLFSLHPLTTFITVACLGIMIWYPKVKNKLFHFLPAPVWVLIFAIPVVFIYRLWIVDFFSISAEPLLYDSQYLINLPADLWSAIVFPDFGKLWTANFWLVVISIMVVTTIETLISTKAVDKLDPLQRKTNLNKDLAAVGASSAVSGLVGGLPIVTVIVRSSVNVNNKGKTGLSNFFHGIILLFFILALKPILEEVPLAALAAILIYTGYKLISPREFAEAYDKGEEQLLVMSFTVLSVLIYGLLWGLFLGLCMAFLVQWVKSRINIKAFVMAIFNPKIQGAQHSDAYVLKLSGVFNFLSLLKIKTAVRKFPRNEKVVVDCEEAVLIDYTVMEYFGVYGKSYVEKGGKWEMRGLDNHESTSNHPYSMRMLSPQHQHSPRWMNEHQRDMMKISAKYGWQFVIGKELSNDDLKCFPIFRAHLVEYTHNTITGLLPKLNLYFTLKDIVIDEGAFIAKIAYDTTVIIIDLQQPVAEFVIEKEELYDKILQRAGFNDIDFEEDKAFSDNVLLSCTDVAAVKRLFHSDFRQFILDNNLYHIECSGNQVLIFGKTQLLSGPEMEDLLEYSIGFMSQLLQPSGEDNTSSLIQIDEAPDSSEPPVE